MVLGYSKFGSMLDSFRLFHPYNTNNRYKRLSIVSLVFNLLSNIKKEREIDDRDRKRDRESERQRDRNIYRQIDR